MKKIRSNFACFSQHHLKLYKKSKLAKLCFQYLISLNIIKHDDSDLEHEIFFFSFLYRLISDFFAHLSHFSVLDTYCKEKTLFSYQYVIIVFRVVQINNKGNNFISIANVFMVFSPILTQFYLRHMGKFQFSHMFMNANHKC